MDHDRDSVAALTAALDAVDRALGQLAEGTYRTCGVCGAALTEAAVTAEPLHPSCAACGATR